MNIPNEIYLEGELVKIGGAWKTTTGTSCECPIEEKPKKIKKIELLECINELYPEIVDIIPSKINELIKAHNEANSKE